MAELLERWLAHVQQPTAVPPPAVTKVSARTSSEPMFATNFVPESLRFHWWFTVARMAIVAVILILCGFGQPEVTILVLSSAGGFALYDKWQTSKNPPRQSGGVGPDSEFATPGRLTSWIGPSFRWCGEQFAAVEQKLRQSPSWTKPWHNPDLQRALLVLGWCVTAWIDLACIVYWFASMAHTLVLIAPLALCMSALSFVVAHAIYRQQNLSVIRRGAFLGLMPLSPGALLRSPLGITTLLWLQQSGVIERLTMKTWAESDLAQAIIRWRAWTGRCVTTGLRLFLWTMLCSAIVLVAMIFYVVPFGPAEYKVVDIFIADLKGADEFVGDKKGYFQLMAKGDGPTVGLYPPVQAFQRREVKIFYGRRSIDLEIGDLIVNKITGEEFTRDGCSALFASVFRSLNPQAEKLIPRLNAHGENLFLALQRLQADGGFSQKLLPKIEPDPRTFSDYLRRFTNAVQGRRGTVPGLIRLGKLLDESLFEEKVPEMIAAYSIVSVPWLILGTLTALASWGWGAWRIVSRRHFRPTKAIPVVTAVV